MAKGSTTAKLKSVLLWLGEPRLFYLALVPVFLGFGVICLARGSEPSLRITGMVLQVLGIGTVIWGISKTRAHFGHPSLSSIFLAWIRRFPLIRRSVALQTDGVRVGLSVTGGRLTSVFQPKSHMPLEERLAHIERGIEIVQDRIAGAERQIDQHKSSVDGQLKAESRKREEQDRSILKNFERSSTGGLHISAIGALWLFVGVILSTASQEIFSIFT